MPKDFTRFKRPRLAHIRQRVTKTQFTDGGSTVGTLDLSDQVPAGAHVLATQVRVITPFTGDTSCTLVVGDGSDADRYNTGTPSVFAAAANGVAMGDPSGVKYHATAATVRLTATSGSDFTLVAAAGELEVTIGFLDFGVTPE